MSIDLSTGIKNESLLGRIEPKTFKSHSDNEY